jgi:hypothetical protein
MQKLKMKPTMNRRFPTIWLLTVPVGPAKENCQKIVKKIKKQMLSKVLEM